MFGVVTELLMQMTPPTATTLVTIEADDKNMFADVQRLLKEVGGAMVGGGVHARVVVGGSLGGAG